MPDVPLDEFFPFTLELTPDESAALIDGFLASIQIVDLRRFNLEVLSKFDSSEMSRAELIAGKHLEGSTLMKLTTEHWLQKWDALKTQPFLKAFQRE
jgi:hypothetical protein